MSKLEELIKEFCPNGVEYKKLGNVCIVETGGEPPENSVKGKHPTGEYIYPIFSNGVGENALWGFSDSYRINIPSVTFSSIGTIGCPTLRETAFTPIIRLKVLYPKNNTELDVRFLKYALETVEFKQQKSSVPNINANMIKSIIIPLPALPVQREIVRILDSFTLYGDELTAELTARRKQYEFYRDKLLCFDNVNIPRVKLKDIATEFYRGYGITREQVTNEGIPCVRYGEIYTTYNTWFDKCVSHTKIDEIASPKYFEYGDILFAITGENVEDIAKSIAYVGNEKCLAGGDIVVMKHKQNPKFLAYALSTFDARQQKSKGKIKSKVVHSNVPSIENIEIYLPPIEVQERIVKVLDNFDAICSDLGIGLPAEIEKRQKQYEYYREKLLTFDMNPATIFNGTERNGTERGLIRLLQYVYGFAFVRLGDICSISSGRNTERLDDGEYPVYGSTGIIAKTNIYKFDCEQILIARVGANAGYVYKAYGKYDVSDNTLILSVNSQYNANFIFYNLINMRLNRFAKGGGQPLITAGQIKELLIPLPTLEKQKEIVEILDKFDSLCNDLSAGLPAEIEYRQKQYEYYRDKLLNFKG